MLTAAGNINQPYTSLGVIHAVVTKPAKEPGCSGGGGLDALDRRPLGRRPDARDAHAPIREARPALLPTGVRFPDLLFLGRRAARGELQRLRPTSSTRPGMVFQAGPRADGLDNPMDRSGRVRQVVHPCRLDIKPGRYDVVVGLWDGRPSELGGGNRPFRVGPGMKALDGNRCQVGTLEISNDAPLPKLPSAVPEIGRLRAHLRRGFPRPPGASPRRAPAPDGSRIRPISATSATPASAILKRIHHSRSRTASSRSRRRKPANAGGRAHLLGRPGREGILPEIWLFRDASKAPQGPSAPGPPSG